ncbi:MAG: peptidylprolyl isomerase [Burkholderiales bacterium]|nr:peptidylprolyl isomerase [Burkholderiales bacterium]
MHNQIRFAPAVLAALIAGAAFAADKPVAVVNGVAIPQTQMDFVLKRQAEQGGQDTPELRGKIRDFLVQKEVLAQEATKQGLDKDPEYLNALEMQKKDLLGGIFVSNYVKKNPVADADLHAEYDKAKGEYDQQSPSDPKSAQVHVRHILVKTEAEANAILAQLKKGKSFEELAKKNSLDEPSKAQGGDLGWMQPTDLVPEFATAMMKLGKGQTSSAPVKTQYGYHIIQVEDKRTRPFPSFEEVKGRIEQMLQGQRIEKMVADLRSKAKVE